MGEASYEHVLRRIERSLEVVATFSRIGEELLAMRAVTAAGANLDRLNRMIDLNRETLIAVRRSLMLSEADLGRATGQKDIRK